MGGETAMATWCPFLLSACGQVPISGTPLNKDGVTRKLFLQVLISLQGPNDTAEQSSPHPGLWLQEVERVSELAVSETL